MRGILPAGTERIGIAVSGGLDSTVLAHLSAAWRRDLNAPPDLVLIHVDHGLRGAESDRDAAFCRALAAELCADFLLQRVDVQGERAEGRWSPEEAARRCRYRALTAAAREADAGVVLLAHHADDQAETVLLNLLRGCGVMGLSGMPVSREVEGISFLRPLLGFERASLRKAALKARWAWCEDSTNASTAYRRNHLRHDVLPRWETEWPGVRQHLLRLGACAGRFAAWMHPRVNAALAEVSQCPDGGADGIRLSIDRLQGVHEPVRQEVWRCAVRTLESAVDAWPFRLARRHVELLESLYRAGRTGARPHLPHGLEAVREDGEIVLRRRGGTAEASAADRNVMPVDLPVGGNAMVGDWRVLLEMVTGTDALQRLGSAGTEYLDADRLSGPLRVRCPEAGDRYCPLGAPGRRLLSDIFGDAKVPRTVRRGAVVVEDAQGIVCVHPGRPAERVRVGEDTRRAFRLRFTPRADMDWVASAD